MLPRYRARDAIRRVVHSWQGPAILGGSILVAVLLWLLPRRVEEVVPVGGGPRWDARSAPPRRQVVWQPARELVPRANAGDEPQAPPGGIDGEARVTPHLADGGMTLLFAMRDASGRSDLWQSQRTPAGWTQPEPLSSVNTPADELGPSVSRDGTELYFYSNRPGGVGGYDLYVARRSETGWGEPRNLGPDINTPAHEYDPALAPDGETLYFASNRTRAMQAARGESAPSGDAKSDAPWSTTLRASPGEATFDLYAARRGGPGADWSAPRAVSSLNRPDTNEGAPLVSPDGSFLYFASDRAARPGEAPNLDLYRVRTRNGAFGEPENLGPTINTPAHETEPALSPEGHLLVFSTNRDGADRIYLSLSEEVEEQSAWDTSHLAALGHGFWWIVALAVLLALGAVLLAVWFRDRIAERIWAARFFLGGVLVNLVFLLALVLWKLPDVVDRIIAKLEAVPGPQFVDENEHQSHEDGRAAYEKVADLAASEAVAVESPRQETEPLSVPERTERPLATIPLEQARLLPPRRLLFVPDERPPAESSQPPASQLARQAPALPRAAIPASLDAPELAAVERPAERDVRAEPTMPRETPPAPAVASSAAPARVAAARRPAAMPLDEVQPTDSAPTVAAAAPPLSTRVSPRPTSVVPESEDVALPAPKAAQELAPVERTAATVARTAVAPAAPPSASVPAALPRLAPSRREVTVQDGGVDSPESAPTARATVAMANAVPRSATSVPVAGATLVEDGPSPRAVARETASDLPVTGADVPRAAPVAPRPGLSGVPELPRMSDRPAAGPVELAVNSTSSGPSVAGPASPLESHRAAPAARTAAASDVAEPVLTAAAGGPEGLASAPEAVQIARARPVVQPAGVKGDEIAVGAARLVAGEAVREAPSPDNDATRPDVASVALPPARAVATTATPLRVAALDEETAALASASSATGETDVGAVDVQIARLDVGRPALAARTPAELSGPVVRRPDRVVVGRPAEIRNDTAPVFGPHVSRLDRPPAKATRVALAEDNAGMRSLFTMRQGAERKQYIELVGGTTETEKAVNLGLLWLKRVQEKDGSWSLTKHGSPSESLDGATGLALLPFLAAGHTHQSGEHKETVASGVKWLVSRQQPDGALFPPGAFRPMYGHGIATIALCEVYGMTGDAALREPVTKALNYIVKAQHGPSGGWRYLPNESADTSVVGWQVMALKSGEMAGIPAPKAALDGAARWLAHVETNKPVGGQFGYLGPGATPAMTAEGLLCLQFLGTGRNDPRMRAGADYLMQHLPRLDNSQTSYYWYYAAQVMYHMQGDYWDAWNGPMREVLVKSQVARGPNAGTWDPRDAYELRAGRLYATSMKLLMLEVYYRHLPLYEQLEK